MQNLVVTFGQDFVVPQVMESGPITKVCKHNHQKLKHSMCIRFRRSFWRRSVVWWAFHVRKIHCSDPVRAVMQAPMYTRFILILSKILKTWKLVRMWRFSEISKNRIEHFTDSNYTNYTRKSLIRIIRIFGQRNNSSYKHVYFYIFIHHSCILIRWPINRSNRFNDFLQLDRLNRFGKTIKSIFSKFWKREFQFFPDFQNLFGFLKFNNQYF